MKTYTLDVDLFIIPNSMCYLSQLCFASFRERLTEICQYNGINTASYNTPIFQVWFVGGDSNNMSRHGFRVGDRVFNAGFLKEYLPAEMFLSAKEGDTVKIHYPVDDDTDLTLNCKLMQKKYRYRNFGTFEECFSKLYNSLHYSD